MNVTNMSEPRSSGFRLLAKLHLRMIRERPEMDLMSVLLLTIVGFLGALGLMLNHAAGSMFLSSGNGSTVLVTASGSNGEVDSFISSSGSAEIRSSLADAGFQRIDFDQQLVMSSSMSADGRQQFVTMRGMTADKVAAHPQLRLVEGRMFDAAANELIVGRAALRAFPTFAIGSQIELARQKWTVTGVFEMDGDVRENELLADLQRVQYTHGAHGVVSSIRIHTADAGNADGIVDAISADQDLEYSARTEAAYFEQQARPVLQSTTRLQTLIMGLMIPTALLGLLSIQRVQSLNMLAELRMLSFIGFLRRDIRLSLIARSLLLGLVSALLISLFVGFGVAGRSVELELGLQLLDIRFEAAPWIHAVIAAGCCLLAASAALMNRMKTEIRN